MSLVALSCVLALPLWSLPLLWMGGAVSDSEPAPTDPVRPAAAVAQPSTALTNEPAPTSSPSPTPSNVAETVTVAPEAPVPAPEATAEVPAPGTSTPDKPPPVEAPSSGDPRGGTFLPGEESTAYTAPAPTKVEPPDDMAEVFSWPTGFSVGAFVDAYAGLNYNLPKPQVGTNAFRSFDMANGFSFSWAGADIAYDGKVGGGTVSLRFGPWALAYNGGDVQWGLAYLKQGYATWKPRVTKGKLVFDLGKFNTLYGAEVAESQDNINYTRGALNWLGQPFFHTGLRVYMQLADMVGASIIAVNGWNNTMDNNPGKSFGAQISVTPSDAFSLFVGYLGGPENADIMDVECLAGTQFDPDTGDCTANAGSPGGTTTVEVADVNAKWRHFVDVVISSQIGERLLLLANADYGIDSVITNPVTGDTSTVRWFGAMLGAQVTWTERWATALRGEYYRDFDGFTMGADATLGTATLTISYRPSPHVVLRLDNRADISDEALFQQGFDDTSRTQFTTTLGLVLH